jgi:hypothetical protein
MGILWGEATAGSASFYERALRIRPVRDWFVTRQGAMRGFRERYLSRMNIQTAMEPAKYAKHTKREGFPTTHALTLRVTA